MPPTPAMQTIIGGAGLALSAALLLLGAIACCRLLRARTTSERLWIALAATVVQVAVVAIVLSPTRWLAPLPFILVQAGIAGGLWLAARGVRPRDVRGGTELPRTPIERVLALPVGVLVLIAIAIAAVTPVNHFDDRAYRASRAAYWLQHRSVLPWRSYNDRQTAFPFGSELAFFWPVLMTRSELPGRLAFALAVPLCAAGLYSVVRQARGTRTSALAAVLLLLTAPAFIYIQEGLFPDLWVALFVLGAAFFALRITAARGRRALDFAMLGVFAALAVNAKTTALALLPAALLAPWLVARLRAGARLRGTAMVAAGFGAGAVLSGLALVCAINVAHDGHPLGSLAMRHWHTAEVSGVQLRTHAARFIVSLIDVPFPPPRPVRSAIGRLGESVLRLFGAAQALPMEGSGSRWPGYYRYGAPIGTASFSVAGIVWLPAILAAAVLGLRRRDRCNRQILVLALTSAALLVGTVFLVRWMGQSERFRVPAFAPGVALVVLLVQRMVRRWPVLRYVAGTVLMVAVVPATWDRARALETALHERPMPPRLLDEPFHRALQQLPRGSRILVVATQDARDYGLFRPREGFVNEVTSWGDEPFDASRMRRLMDDQRITHVLVQDDVELYMEWEPPLRTVEMVRWLAAQPDLVERPVGSPGMRLFARG